MRARAHLFFLGLSAIASTGALAVVKNFDTSRLANFGPTAKIYFIGIESGLVTATVILALSLVCAVFFQKQIIRLYEYARSLYSPISDTKKNLIILAICIVFAFGSQATNIMNGYFNMDDFEIIGVSHTTSFGESLFTPHGNDHTIPLFRTEVKILDSLFGQSHVPYSVFVFLVFAFIPFFTYLIFKKISIDTPFFFIFLVMFSGAAGWADMLTGFYIMSIYIQILLFFCISVWSYMAWIESRQKKYMIYFCLALASALATDISGMWVVPVLLFCMIIFCRIRSIDFFRENKVPILGIVGISAAFGLFLFYTFTVIQPNTFLSTLSAENMDATFSAREKKESWRPLPLAGNFLSFFANGVSLSAVAPNAVKILAHPAVLEKAKSVWPIVVTLILAGNVLFIRLLFKKALPAEKKIIILLLSSMAVTIGMVVIARPNHEIIPDFDYRYAGVPYYFYVILLSVGASILYRIKVRQAVRILIPTVIILFSLQQIFAFHSIRLKSEAVARKEAIVKMRTGLFGQFAHMSEANNNTLIIPNLSGEYIFQPMPGFSLAHYLIFFDNQIPIRLVKNQYMPTDSRTKIVETVQSLRSITSQAFKDAMKNDGAVRDYYGKASLMRYQTLDASDVQIKSPIRSENFTLESYPVDPEKKHVVELSFYTNDVAGNLELSFSFKNDFGIEGKNGKIRIDDYTSYDVREGKRLYRIQTDLLQVYAYSLSERISDLVLSVPQSKNMALVEAKLF